MAQAQLAQLSQQVVYQETRKMPLEMSMHWRLSKHFDPKIQGGTIFHNYFMMSEVDDEGDVAPEREPEYLFLN